MGTSELEKQGESDIRIVLHDVLEVTGLLGLSTRISNPKVLRHAPLASQFCEGICHYWTNDLSMSA